MLKSQVLYFSISNFIKGFSFSKIPRLEQQEKWFTQWLLYLIDGISWVGKDYFKLTHKTHNAILRS